MSSIIELVDRINTKNPVFTVTAGRTGTTYVSHLFALLPDTYSVHETKPDFVVAMRPAQVDPAKGMMFSTKVKLPHIASVPQSRYVETSHLFCKGFMECFIRLGIKPALLILRKSPRAIALSLLSRKTIPARTALGWKYLLAPTDRGVLPLERWQLLTDYQLCYWYCLEIERRQALYAAYQEENALPWFGVEVDDLKDYRIYTDMLRTLGFTWDDTFEPQLQTGHATISGTQHNLNRTSIEINESRLLQWEDEVWDSVSYSDPGLRSRTEKRYS